MAEAVALESRHERERNHKRRVSKSPSQTEKNYLPPRWLLDGAQQVFVEERLRAEARGIVDLFNCFVEECGGSTCTERYGPCVYYTGCEIQAVKSYVTERNKLAALIVLLGRRSPGGKVLTT